MTVTKCARAYGLHPLPALLYGLSTVRGRERERERVFDRGRPEIGKDTFKSRDSAVKLK